MLDYLLLFIDFVLHIDVHLDLLIQQYGLWTYIILFTIIFFETAFVITPFLPGDSLLFAAGAFAARGSLSITVILVSLALASIFGDTVNYHIGKNLGPKVFRKEKHVLFNREYLTRTEKFYEKHGPRTIVLARFIPIIRTFAPFVAGIGKMPYPKFLFYNIAGGIVWVLLFGLGGYFFGTIPFVEENFSLVVLAIIILSLVPAVKEGIQHWRYREHEPAETGKKFYRKTE